MEADNINISVFAFISAPTLIRIKKIEIKPVPYLYFHIIDYLTIFYLACSNCNVLVGSSQTSVGPKYWIGPG